VSYRAALPRGARPPASPSHRACAVASFVLGDDRPRRLSPDALLQLQYTFVSGEVAASAGAAADTKPAAVAAPSSFVRRQLTE
jgi:hypothetical protein